ncbi:MAG: hypothetical protein RLY58_493, partial [Pseudomonadota bacterium]
RGGIAGVYTHGVIDTKTPKSMLGRVMTQQMSWAFKLVL